MLENTFGDWRYQGTRLENMGGARTFRFAVVEAFATLAHAVQGVVNSASTFTGDGEWTLVIPIEDSANLNEEEERSRGGPFYENKFTCELAGETAAGRMMLDSMARVPVIAEVTDNNGLVRRMGELGDPAFITVRHATGRGTSSRSAWTVLIEWNSERPLYVVDPAFVPEPPPEEDDDSDSIGDTSEVFGSG